MQWKGNKMIIAEKIIDQNLKVTLEQINHDTYQYKIEDLDAGEIAGIKRGKNLDILKEYYDKTI
jgi:hypothetical protein